MRPKGVLSVVGAILLWSCTTNTQEQTLPLEAAPPETGNHVIRVYPSAHLWPVSEPYLFYWELGAAPSYPGSVANAQGVSNGTQAQEQIKKDRMPIQWTYGPEWPYGRTKEAFIKYYSEAIRPYRAQMVDEWQSPKLGAAAGDPLSINDPYGIEGSIEGIALAKKQSPGTLILIAWRGENSLLPLVKKGGVDYILIEGYSNLPKTYPQSWAIDTHGVDARIARARSWGMITHTIPWLGEILANDQYAPGHVLTAQDLAQQIKHYREVAPEMPGLAFYANTNSALAEAADRLCKEYYVDPAPTVSIDRPTEGSTIPRRSQVITASARGKDARGIREYLGFIDNKLVYEGKANHFRWNFVNASPGKHIITVQAIDTGWNRGVKQIEVIVD